MAKYEDMKDLIGQWYMKDCGVAWSEKWGRNSIICEDERENNWNMKWNGKMKRRMAKEMRRLYVILMTNMEKPVMWI